MRLSILFLLTERRGHKAMLETSKNKKRFSGFKFGENFRALLQKIDEKELNELIELLGVSTSAFRQWTNENTLPTGEKLYKIAKHFNVSTDWLLGITDIRSPDVEIQAASKKFTLYEEMLLECENWKK